MDGNKKNIFFHLSSKAASQYCDMLVQCSCLENPRGGGAWWVAIYGVAQSWTRLKQLSSSSSSSFIYSCLCYIAKCLYFNTHIICNFSNIFIGRGNGRCFFGVLVPCFWNNIEVYILSLPSLLIS